MPMLPCLQGFDNDTNTMLCTIKLTKRLFPDAKPTTLDNLAKVFKFPSFQHHRAMSDAQTTVRLWRHLYQQATEQLGFAPPLAFFKTLEKTSAKDVQSFIQQYKSQHNKAEKL